MKESRKGFSRRGMGKSLDAEEPKTENTPDPAVERLVRAVWRRRMSEAERRVQKGVSS